MTVPPTVPARRTAGPRHRLAAPAVAAASLLLLAACSGESNVDAASDGAGEGDYPVEITNCDRTLTFDQAPERVVSLAQPQTDLMVELGLADRVVGQAQVSPADGLAGSSEDSDEAADIEVLTEDDVPSREVTVSQAPDLVLAPSTWEYTTEQGYAGVEDLEEAEAQPYLAYGGCADRRTSRSVDDTLEDIEAMGRVFGVEERAGELAGSYQEALDEVASAVEGAEPVRVAEVYVWGSEIQSLVGSSGNDIVAAAGGENVFAAGDPRFDGLLFATLSPEVVAATEPEAFVFSASSEEAAEAVRETLRSTFPSTPAVQDDRLIAYSATASLSGSLTTPDAVRHIAQELHPEAF